MKKYMEVFLILVMVLSVLTGCTNNNEKLIQGIVDKYITEVENAGHITTITHEKIDTELRKVPNIQSYLIDGTTYSNSGDEVYIIVQGVINGNPFKVIKTGVSKKSYAKQ